MYTIILVVLAGVGFFWILPNLEAKWRYRKGALGHWYGRARWYEYILAFGVVIFALFMSFKIFEIVKVGADITLGEGTGNFLGSVVWFAVVIFSVLKMEKLITKKYEYLLENNKVNSKSEGV